MRKLICMTLALAGVGTAAPAAAEGWSEFTPLRRNHDRTYVFFVPGEPGRSGRFASWDDGYFRHGGGVRASHRTASFDYDRDYPYDYRSGTSAAAEAEPGSWREPACTVERVRDGDDGWSDVRVCRN